ncbi:helix-turn-helix domain-containing protein [Salicola sp. Rm-C-2C1-2]|uniref:helix-turn-helix transcriptional regulator n=1 Tax=Salicola sp. Rm-C-2C1-2 TaxID=3141321 RepID=UPI0032E49DA7
MDVPTRSTQDTQAYDVPILPPRYVTHFLHFMEQYGVRPPALLDGTGVDASQLETSGESLTMNELLVLLQHASDLTEDERLPFEFGKQLDIDAHGLVGAAVLWQNDYFRLVEMIIEYERVSLPIYDLRLSLKDETVLIQLHDLWDLRDLRSFMIRIYMGSIYELSRHICKDMLLELDTSTKLLADDWQHVAPEAEIRFNAEAARATLHPAQQSGSDTGQELSSFLARHRSRQDLKGAENNSSLTERVRRQILDDPGLNCTLERVAENLQMTPRSLRRHLQAENYSFRDLRNEIRCHYAERYLADTRMPLSTIAQKLGFSDQASFTRAYRSWTGHTPGQTRR